MFVLKCRLHTGLCSLGGAMGIPCYVSGKGMHATDRTRQFKVEVIEILESTGRGYDTRYRYYRQQFPDMDSGGFCRKVAFSRVWKSLSH